MGPRLQDARASRTSLRRLFRHCRWSGPWGDDCPRRQQPLGSTQGTYAGLVCNSTISLYVPPVDIRDSCVPTSVTRLS